LRVTNISIKESFIKNNENRIMMKHTLKITIILVLVFLIAQIVGLAVVNKYIDHKATEETGKVTFSKLPFNMERPPIEEKTSFIFILSAILIGTLIVLLLVRFRKKNLWKLWFLFAVIVCLAIAFSAFVAQQIALLLAIVLALYKVFKPNIWIHNLTEVFIYGGLAAIFVPIMNLFAVFALLILISIYDMIAVWKSKHMIKLAKFQTASKVFAGLFIPYGGKMNAPAPSKHTTKVKVKNAILGGGDIGFPLLFAGVVMKDLMLVNSVAAGFLKTLIIPLVVSVALLILFIKGEKNKFYPAMPFLTIGCFVGYLVVLLL